MIGMFIAVAVIFLGVGVAVGGAMASKTAPPAPLPQATPQQRKMMGLDTPLDQKVPVAVRDWNAMKLALWRNKAAWDVVARESADLVARAAHMEGCPGKSAETEPCLPDCPDRELRLSALVVLNAARPFAALDVNRPADAPYFAPSREYYSSLIAELAASRAELESLRGKHMVEPPVPTKQLEEAT